MTVKDEIVEKFAPKADEFRDNIIQKYSQVVDKIQPEHFEPVKKLLKEFHLEVDVKKSVEMIKHDLKDEIKKTFVANWDESELSNSIMQLEYSKSLVTNNDKKWRPTGKSAEEQTRVLRIKKLMERKKVLENQLKFQQQRIDEYVDEITKNREVINDQIIDEQNTKEEVELDDEVLNRIQQHINERH